MWQVKDLVQCELLVLLTFHNFNWLSVKAEVAVVQELDVEDSLLAASENVEQFLCVPEIVIVNAIISRAEVVVGGRVELHAAPVGPPEFDLAVV